VRIEDSYECLDRSTGEQEAEGCLLLERRARRFVKSVAFEAELSVRILWKQKTDKKIKNKVANANFSIFKKNSKKFEKSA